MANTANKPTTAPKPTTSAPSAPKQAALPTAANTVAYSPNATLIMLPGVLYGLAVQQGPATVVLPFMLPPCSATGKAYPAGVPVQGKCTGPNKYWLGRDGVGLVAHVYGNAVLPGSVVAMQPSLNQAGTWLITPYTPACIGTNAKVAQVYVTRL